MRGGRANPLVVRSLKAALHEFLKAPATGGHITNDHLVQTVEGAKGTRAVDCPTYDNVRIKYSKPKACTFVAAFNACWHGSRDWREFDLEALQDSHEAFAHLGLPERVETAIQHAAIAEEHAGHAQTDDTEYPPLELLHRAGPRTRRRKARGAKAKARGCKGSRNACSRSALAKRYQAAKREYHNAGEQLRMAGIRGELL